VIGDKGYLLLPWLMVPHKQTNERHYVMHVLFNKRFFWAIVLVENNFSL